PAQVLSREKIADGVRPAVCQLINPGRESDFSEEASRQTSFRYSRAARASNGRRSRGTARRLLASTFVRHPTFPTSSPNTPTPEAVRKPRCEQDPCVRCSQEAGGIRRWPCPCRRAPD